MRPMYGNDTNCQETQGVQIGPKKPISHMWSVTNSSIPAGKQFNHKKCNPEDKNCQSTTCFKKKFPVRPVSDDKNCQSANLM